MTPPLKGVTAVDFAVIAAYMALMLGIGFYAMRFNRGASDYFKGGSRIHWLAAGLSSFMSGFSAWTFTGAAEGQAGGQPPGQKEGQAAAAKGHELLPGRREPGRARAYSKSTCV